jgi:16S rRNA (adenine1518-N6/adenine1519-N6)-dimethyltransferase
VVEVGAGFGSLTVALAATGARVLAIEFDRALVPALHEVVGDAANVRVLAADATKLDWTGEIDDGPWVLCSNLPYNIAVPVVLDVLERAPSADRLVVLVQREVGERFAAGPGHEQYGPVSLRVAFRARAELVRRVPREVFWPRPAAVSVVVRLRRRPRPPVDVDEERLWRVVDAGFAERRKTIRSAVVRLGVDRERADDLLRGCAIDPRARAEQLPLEAFAAIAEALP